MLAAGEGEAGMIAQDVHRVGRCDARVWRFRVDGGWTLAQCRRRGYGDADVVLCPRHSTEALGVIARREYWAVAPAGLLREIDSGMSVDDVGGQP